jgi:hypothetical protein
LLKSRLTIISLRARQGLPRSGRNVSLPETENVGIPYIRPPRVSFRKPRFSTRNGSADSPETQRPQFRLSSSSVQISRLLLALAVAAVVGAQDNHLSLTVKQAEALVLNAPPTLHAAQGTCCPHADSVAVKAGSADAPRVYCRSTHPQLHGESEDWSAPRHGIRHKASPAGCGRRGGGGEHLKR